MMARMVGGFEGEAALTDSYLLANERWENIGTYLRHSARIPDICDS